jgi:MFS transporter, DHA1 family, inner membrane transport protein
MIDRRAFILSTGMFAVGTDAFVIAGILPETARSLSTSIEQTGLVVSVVLHRLCGRIAAAGGVQ